ncbi:MAG: hypothetical protein V4683_00815 [Bacteroidota bacterium]
MNFQKKPLWLVKLLHFEYWTWWVFYLPLLPWYLWQAIRAKSLTYFSNVDPCIDYGGFFGESKSAILEKINKKYLPKTLLISTDQTFESVINRLKVNEIQFPVICKPDIGERGNGVEKVESLESLNNYHLNNLNYIIQEFIDFPIELGVLYYRLPSEACGHITSITKKSFLKVTGDNKNTIEELMELSDRARFQLDSMRKRLGNQIKRIPKEDEIVLLEPIGNHCRGTTFLDNNHLISKELENVFDEISKPIIGFHYGRFDLRVKSVEDLYRGENIKIMELNGVSADPGHIYDPDYKLFYAYGDVAKHWKILADLSILQQKNGIEPIPIKILWPVVKEHFF